MVTHCALKMAYFAIALLCLGMTVHYCVSAVPCCALALSTITVSYCAIIVAQLAIIIACCAIRVPR